MTVYDVIQDIDDDIDDEIVMVSLDLIVIFSRSHKHL